MATTYEDLLRQIRQSGLQVSSADLQRALVDQNYANSSLQNAKDYASATTPQAAALAQVNQSALSQAWPTREELNSYANNATHSSFGEPVQRNMLYSAGDSDTLPTPGDFGISDSSPFAQQQAAGNDYLDANGGTSGQANVTFVWTPTGGKTSSGYDIYSNSSGQTGYEDSRGNWHTTTDLGDGRIRDETLYVNGAGGDGGIMGKPSRTVSKTKSATDAAPATSFTSDIGSKPTYDPSSVGEAPTYDPSSVGEAPTYDPSSVGDAPTYDPSSAGERPTYEIDPQTQQTIDDLVAQIVGWEDYNSPYADMIREALEGIIGYGDYSSPYAQEIADLVKSITGRDPFSYNLDTDPVWQAYKKQYTREGNRSMQDALANAALMTGGVPSTAAMTAAQQAGNYYNAQMTDKIPELYQQAYYRYADEGNRMLSNLAALQGLDQDAYGRFVDKYGRLVNNLDVLQGLDQTEYGRYNDKFNRTLTGLDVVRALENDQYSRYRDTVGDWERDRDFNYDQYLDQLSQWNKNRDFDYGQYLDALSQWNKNRDFDYGQYIDSLSQWNKNRDFDYGQYLDALNQWNKDRDFNFDAYRDARNFEYDKSRDQIGDSRYNQEYSDSRSDLAYDRAWNEAVTAAKYGDYSKLQALGINPDSGEPVSLSGGSMKPKEPSKKKTDDTKTQDTRDYKKNPLMPDQFSAAASDLMKTLQKDLYMQNGLVTPQVMNRLESALSSGVVTDAEMQSIMTLLGMD